MTAEFFAACNKTLGKAQLKGTSRTLPASPNGHITLRCSSMAMGKCGNLRTKPLSFENGYLWVLEKYDARGTHALGSTKSWLEPKVSTGTFFSVAGKPRTTKERERGERGRDCGLFPPRGSFFCVYTSVGDGETTSRSTAWINYMCASVNHGLTEGAILLKGEG